MGDASITGGGTKLRHTGRIGLRRWEARREALEEHSFTEQLWMLQRTAVFVHMHGSAGVHVAFLRTGMSKSTSQSTLESPFGTTKLDYNILVYIQGTVQAVSDSSLTFLNILSPIIFPGTVFVELRPWGFSYVQWAGTLEEDIKAG